jgi:hypothetical protein
MKRTGLSLAFLALGWAPALAADRLTDKDVKALVSRIEEARDRFDNALDDKLKRSIVRGPAGEVNVDNFLNDFQESIDRLEERLKPEYAASAEAGSLLRQATAIDRFFRAQPPGTRGESEWNRLTTDLKTLAAAYGTEFPLADNAAVRRIGDKELAASIEQVARVGNQLKKSLDNDLKRDTTVDKAARQAAVSEVDQLQKDAKTLRERVKDGNPSSAEAERLLAQAAKVQNFISGRQLPTSSAAWSGVASPLQSLASAYGAAWPATR